MAEAEAITIPSPSVFLRDSPPAPEPAKSARPQHVRKQSTETKKKAPSRKASLASGNPGDGNGVKPKQSKSRNGCITCKAKRLKCGEEKPSCQQCKKRNVDCGGYKKDFKWRPFEETNVKVNIDRQQGNIVQQLPAKKASPPDQTLASSSKRTSPVREEAPPPSQSQPSQQDASTARKDSKRSSAEREEQQSTSLPQRPAKAKRKTEPSTQKGPPPSQAKELSEPEASPDEEPERSQESRSIPILNQPAPTGHGPSTSPAPALGMSPTLTEIIMPFADENDDGDYINFDLPDGIQYPLPSSGNIDPALLDDLPTDGGLFELLGDSPSPGGMPLSLSRRHSPRSTGSVISPSDLYGSFQGPVSYLYSQPNFPQDSMEMLTFRFDKLTCGILSVMDGPSENPWRTLIWPLALQSPALYHAVTAMTAFHSSKDIPALRLVGHEHKQASIRYIQEGIRDRSMNDQTAIATALALGFSESWDQHTASGNTHIKGAQALVKRALMEHQINPLHGVELARLKFLCNAWVYMDVIARLTAVDSDLSNDFDNTFLFAGDSPDLVMGENGNTGFGIDFGTGIDARLDPLMGCANTLFPLIGRVANLVRKVCRSQNNSPAVISQANDLKLALETWDPPAFIERPEDPTTDVQHTLQTAEAYRWATLLHLHSAVPELPSPSSTELAQRVLTYLATVPLVSRTVIVQIYPLMVAGCEATTAEDRQWVRERWTAMGHRMRIGVIDKSATVTEEVWRRRAAYEAQPSQRRRLVATAELQPPPRQRGVPPAAIMRRGNRNASEGHLEDSDPGRTGIVFSCVEAADYDDKPGPDERFPPKPHALRRAIGGMDAAYTVRGHLHWVGVMWDWGWEILLG
ncbi:hypothetical protein KC348_g10535 [Hortaea werneckii]|uniref:Zn(2)-C6 fungal-type domain-containing protein n=1 Tax=Hortaea werneckii EXF-2000 TaxID=1157616 RepID=A0A1Z5T9J6_HORWE|nr:hypothetical protein KC358_g10656 [Hortaea werneckii]OTA32703.1 hypothetical protein BTJ68_08875 [Hortaea werneckii EXF-2000]KAI6919827.1 hypothetical protein KC348_g10535 [Hortaea werneckii]KAI6930280.1 hypothetical protein KC341_g10339 [Hortaea werneckii]KAI6964557.1 hypothetical protein KC321_g10606 [Hortaea werneckii]